MPRIATASVEAARDFLRATLDRGHEGIMAKAPDAPYEAGRRGWLSSLQADTLAAVLTPAGRSLS